jgi:hypothetical protein
MEKQDNLNKEADDIRNALKNIPYEILLKERQANLRLFDHQLGQTADTKGTGLKGSQVAIDKTIAVRKHKKGRPDERSCRERPNMAKTIFEKPRAVFSDPRFEEHTGQLDMSKFLKSYDFLKDAKEKEIKETERMLKNKKKIKKTNKDLITDLKSQKAANQVQIRQIDTLNKKFEIKKQLKKDFKDRGLNPAFIKRRSFIRKYRRSF